MKITEVMEDVLSASQAQQTIVVAIDYDKLNFRWANSGLTTNGRAQRSYLAVISVIDKRVGTFIDTLNQQTDPKRLAVLSEQAALAAPPAKDYAPLLKGNGRWQMGQSQGKMTGLNHITDKLDQVLETALRRKMMVFGYAELGRYDYYVATSSGVRKHYSHDEGQFELNAKTKDYANSVWIGSPLKEFSEVDPTQLFERLETKLKWSKQSIALPPGKYEVLLEPSAVADMLLFAYWESAARTAEEGHSAYSRRGGTLIGQQLYRPEISIYSDPFEPSLEVVPFNITYTSSNEESVFDNGFNLKKTYWVKDGRQQHLLAPRYLAQQKKYPKATPYIPNLVFKHDGPNIDEMVKSTKLGLLVTSLWYMREVDPQNLLVTGLTRDGVFLVRNGRVEGAVNNFRFNMSPLNMLKQVQEIGSSQRTLAREFGDYLPLTIMPPLRIKDFFMSSVSQAK